MRMLMRVSVPVEAGNQTIKDGTLPKTFMGFIERVKPEAAYFLAEDGQRTGYFVFDLKDTRSIPMLAEPLFDHLQACITLTPVMNAEDMKAGVELARHS